MCNVRAKHFRVVWGRVILAYGAVRTLSHRGSHYSCYAMSGHWFSWADTGPGSPLNSLCSPDLTLPDFWRNDLGRFTPCFIDLAVLGARCLQSGPAQQPETVAQQL